jgi:hypothetical protein
MALKRYGSGKGSVVKISLKSNEAIIGRAAAVGIRSWAVLAVARDEVISAARAIPAVQWNGVERLRMSRIDHIAQNPNPLVVGASGLTLGAHPPTICRSEVVSAAGAPPQM